MKSWKTVATAAYKRCVAAGLWSDELADRNYSGAGGAVHPDGSLMNLPADDVAWEQLYADCMAVLAEA